MNKDHGGLNEGVKKMINETFQDINQIAQSAYCDGFRDGQKSRDSMVWKTRDGRLVHIISTSVPSEYPIVGYFANSTLKLACSWMADGRFRAESEDGALIIPEDIAAEMAKKTSRTVPRSYGGGKMSFEDAMDKQAYDEGLVAGRADRPDAPFTYERGTIPFYSWSAGFFDGASEISKKAGDYWMGTHLSRVAREFKDAVISHKQEAA